jgi:hypothetical protein
MMKTMYNVLMVGLLLMCGRVLAGPDASDSAAWKALREKNSRPDVSATRVDQTLDSCRRRGLSAKDADELLAAVYTARAEHLPVGCIYDRIEEGLAKQVEVARVASAAKIRLECLRKAGVITASIYGDSPGGQGGGPAHLLEHVAMALESGLPDDVLTEMFRHNGRRRIGRLTHVVEAGETLQLAGLAPDQIKQVMIDFLDRNLNRSEVMRAVGVLTDGLSAGKSFENVYANLWVVPD